MESGGGCFSVLDLGNNHGYREKQVLAKWVSYYNSLSIVQRHIAYKRAHIAKLGKFRRVHKTSTDRFLTLATDISWAKNRIHPPHRLQTRWSTTP
ncbi:Serine/threonine-protein kinase hal4 [Fusarium oxysporum f. sp. albedinis]|nr:hypothetical protein HZ326_25789 [Fusarium oxysporum f. sp. albedinis]KAJ0132879.1 Serine/threonine-protein kinase hal4 [Fusarium oxysporum f. sp. albedinis]